MKSSIFQDAMEASTKVFGRKNVEVAFAGSEAKTNGNTVVLPALPPSAEINVDQANVIRGYRDHEAMHVRVTDTSPEMIKRMEAIKNTGNKHLMQLTQFCEDIRIENAGIQEYPGMKTGLSATNTEAAKMLMGQIEECGKPEDVIPQLPRPLMFRLAAQSIARSKIGVESNGVYEAINEHIKAHDPGLHALAEKCADMMVNLPTGFDDGLLDEERSKKGTMESLKTAAQIFRMYEDYSDVNPPPPPDGQGDGEGQGQGQGEGGGQGGGEGDGESDGQGQGAGSGQGQQQGGGQGGSQGQQQGAGQQGDSGEQQQPPQPQQDQPGAGGGGGGKLGGDNSANTNKQPPPELDDSNLFKDALNKTVEDIENHGTEKIGSGKSERTRTRYAQWTNDFVHRVPFIDYLRYANSIKKGDAQDAAMMRRHTARAKRISDAVSGKRAMIRRILELELMARSDRRWESGKKSGRLQSVRLVDAIQGKESVYQKRCDGKDMDTLLMISIDGSGSMQGTNAIESATLALALSEAIERTGCDITVLTWGDVHYFVPGKPTLEDLKSKHKEFHEYLQEAEKSRGNNYEYKGVGTPPKYASFGHVTRAVVKEKRQRTSEPSVLASFGASCETLDSGTPSYAAIFADLNELAKETHSKKIYLHLTDGQPGGCYDRVNPKDVMRDAHRYAESIGVHMIGIGIDGADVSGMFKDYVNVKGADAYEPVIKKLAKLIAKESGNGNSRRAA